MHLPLFEVWAPEIRAGFVFGRDQYMFIGWLNDSLEYIMKDGEKWHYLTRDATAGRWQTVYKEEENKLNFPNQLGETSCPSCLCGCICYALVTCENYCCLCNPQPVHPGAIGKCKYALGGFWGAVSGLFTFLRNQGVWCLHRLPCSEWIPCTMKLFLLSSWQAGEKKKKTRGKAFKKLKGRAE